MFGLEVSRLARNNRDWYQLLDLCGLTNTLIVDAEGIYDPRQPNDRLLLGLKGTLSEVELGWIRQRAHAGLLAKAQRGELFLGAPVSYIQTPDGHLEKHPDRRIQDAVVLVFEKFAELGSVRQVLLWFRHDHMVCNPASGLALAPCTAAVCNRAHSQEVVRSYDPLRYILKVPVPPTFFGSTYRSTGSLDLSARAQ